MLRAKASWYENIVELEGRTSNEDRPQDHNNDHHNHNDDRQRKRERR